MNLPFDTDPALDPRLPELLRLVGQHTGIHIPEDRIGEVIRKLPAIARDLGCRASIGLVLDELSHAPKQVLVETIASHLTVGETYFYRDRAAFDVLTTELLPRLAARRADMVTPVRIWSAGCSSGEEAYSLAFVTARARADEVPCQTAILATDINPRALDKAVRGVYGPWSFRQTPDWIRSSCFEKSGIDTWQVLPRYREMVTFAHLNLVDDSFPFPVAGTSGVDVIFCRNVLMYLTPQAVAETLRRLHACLAPEGWLIVSPVEVGCLSHPGLVSRQLLGITLYQKTDSTEGRPVSQALSVSSILDTTAGLRTADAPPAPVSDVPLQPDSTLQANAFCSPSADSPQEEESPSGLEEACRLYEACEYEACLPHLEKLHAEAPADDRVAELLYSCTVNLGRLEHAEQLCVRQIAELKLSPQWHYRHALVLAETGRPRQAASALQRALYLDPAFVPAHVMLSAVFRACGRPGDAARHHAAALRGLSNRPLDELVPFSDKMSVGEMRNLLEQLARSSETDRV